MLRQMKKTPGSRQLETSNILLKSETNSEKGKINTYIHLKFFKLNLVFIHVFRGGVKFRTKQCIKIISFI